MWDVAATPDAILSHLSDIGTVLTPFLFCMAELKEHSPSLELSYSFQTLRRKPCSSYKVHLIHSQP